MIRHVRHACTRARARCSLTFAICEGRLLSTLMLGTWDENWTRTDRFRVTDLARRANLLSSVNENVHVFIILVSFPLPLSTPSFKLFKIFLFVYYIASPCSALSMAVYIYSQKKIIVMLAVVLSVCKFNF